MKEAPRWKWMLPGIVIGFVVTIIIMCGLASALCAFEVSPQHLTCPRPTPTVITSVPTTPAPVTFTPVTFTPTTPDPAAPVPTTPVPFQTLNLYLPRDLESASSKIQSQLDEFENANPGVTISITYYSNLQDIEEVGKGNPDGLVALESRNVINFAQAELLLPVASLQRGQDAQQSALLETYLTDALASDTFNGQVYAYPWYRDSCSPRYVNLAVFAENSQATINIGSQLSAFLSNTTNQQINLRELNWYPTLNQFYDSGQLVCIPLTVTPPPEEPIENRLAVALAQSLSNPFLEIYNVHINPFGATGFNPALIQSDSAQLIGMIAPVIDANQSYKDRQVEGIININDSRLVIETIMAINKTVVQQYGFLPLGSYMIACQLQRLDDCIAVSLEGEEFQIRPESVYETDLADPVLIPNVKYEHGSIRKCFYVARRKICIKVF